MIEAYLTYAINSFEWQFWANMACTQFTRLGARVGRTRFLCIIHPLKGIERAHPSGILESSTASRRHDLSPRKMNWKRISPNPRALNENEAEFSFTNFMKSKSFIILTALLGSGLLISQGADTAIRYKVDPSASSIQWHGAKVGTDHFGKVRLKNGWLTITGDQITGGEFIVDMTSISNDDLNSKSKNKKLVRHLMSKDFFSVKKFPESKFVVSKATAKSPGVYEFLGKLTIRGITQPLAFNASVTVTGKQLRGKGTLTFNRAMHDVKFHSGTIAQLGDKLINDEVPLEIELVAKAQ